MPDARNHGQSPHSSRHTYPDLAADLRSFLSYHKLENATLIGHSMGARASMFLSLVDPASVSKLVVVDASPIHATPEYGVKSLQAYFKALAAAKVETVPFEYNVLKAKKEMDVRLEEAGLSSASRQWMLLNLARLEKARRYAWRFNLDAFESNLVDHLTLVPHQSAWTPFEGKTLFLGGEKSGYIPTDAHGDIRRWFPNAAFDYVSDSGHYVHVDNAEDFLVKLIPFLLEK